MNYRDALRWLYGLSARGVRLELDRMRGGLAHRGNPHRRLKVVHVAGSNGKGSVSAMTERVLREAGYKTGLFTSPHLQRFVERFRINGRPLSEREVARRLTDQHAAASSMPPLTFFEHSALLAFEAFRDHECDVCVIEVGLGGRLDATNVFDRPLVSVVTNISIEHRRILGDTLAKIAREKGGVFRERRPVVIGAKAPEARRVLSRLARRKNCDPWLAGRDFAGTPTKTGALLRVGDRERDLRLGLKGDHQADNAAVVAALVQRLRKQRWRVSDDALESGLAKARWPGRMETLRRRPATPEFLVDCAHNPDGCVALAAHLRTLRPRKTVLLFGALRDKQLEPMLGAFDGLVHRRIYALPAIHRAPESTAVYARVRSGTEARSVQDAIARSIRAAGPDGRVVVAGSIFLVSEVRAAVLGTRSDPPIAM
ncbi:MAG: folylpolyglutamate synthase/dihydrofolate synthase family protein [Myxococcota bacterium]